MATSDDLFNAAIDHAISLGLEGHLFLESWREGDWDSCKKFGFDTHEIEAQHKAFASPDDPLGDLDDDHPLWLINEQIKGLLEGDGASEDHEAVVEFQRAAGLPSGTVSRMHRAIVSSEARKAVCEHACKGIDTETLIHAGVVQRGELVDVLRQIDEIRQRIADDGFACTFQSLGQYRAALLKSITATAEEVFNTEQAKTGGMPYGTYGGL